MKLLKFNMCFLMAIIYVSDVDIFHVHSLLEIAKTRGSSSNITSTEELAMHRSLSEFLFQTFAKPNTVKIVRENMIDAALAVSKKTD